MIRSLVSLLLFACAALAQVVHVENFGTQFKGWLRATVNREPDRQIGKAGDVLFVVGRPCGRDTRVVDLFVELGAGEHRTIDLHRTTPAPWVLAPLPPELLGYFGGFPAIAGVQMDLLEYGVDGASVWTHWRKRTGRTLCVDLWVDLYPDQPHVARGEIRIVAQNPAVPDKSELATDALRLTFGDSLLCVPGRPFGTPLLEVGTKLCDGQARGFPCTFVWLQHVRDAVAWSTVGCYANEAIGVVGISQLLPIGNPQMPPGFTARSWVLANTRESVRRLHTWEAAVCGPAPQSGITGAQEEQVFPRGEMMLADGAGADVVTRLSAMKILGRPCHFLGLNGDPFVAAAHPACVTWDGRPHWHLAVSPDRLGSKDLTPSDTTFAIPGTSTSVLWQGPDREHWMYSTLAAGARVSGSRLLQTELEVQAQLYLAGETVPSMKPGWSTNGPGAARAVGYATMLVVRLDQDLENRTLAGLLVARSVKRASEVYVNLGVGQNDVWDIRNDDPRLGPGARWIPWQQSVGAWGLWEWGVRFNNAAARAIALRAAKRVIDDAYVLPASLVDEPNELPRLPADAALIEKTIVKGDVTDRMEDIYTPMRAALQAPRRARAAQRGFDVAGVDELLWTSRDVVALDGAQVTVGYFDMFGTPLAAAVVLQAEPEHVKAGQIVRQWFDRCAAVPQYWRWVPAGLQVQ